MPYNHVNIHTLYGFEHSHQNTTCWREGGHLALRMIPDSANFAGVTVLFATSHTSLRDVW